MPCIQSLANGALTLSCSFAKACRFFMERMLPETAAHVARIQSGAGSVMELADEAF